MTTNTGTYREASPEGFEPTTKSWEELGYSAQYYHYNKSDGKQVEYNQNVRDRNRDFVEGVKSDASCDLCDEGYSACLVFHHLRDKEKTIPRMVSNGYSIESIVAEMNKCVILCANCHRKYHDGKFDGVEFEELSLDAP